MYFLKYGNEYIHDPRTARDKRLVTDLKLSGEANSCGYCDFTIYPDHPAYNKLVERDSVNQIEVYDDDEWLFSGYIYEIDEDFYKARSVKCKGELDYLSDSIVRPYSTLSRTYGQKAPEKLDEYFAWLIDQHNKQVDISKRFTVGINQGRSLDANNYIYRENDRYPTTIEEISEKLLNNKNAGGFLRIRHENGIRYIDYLSEWTDVNLQVLDFGINLTKYSQADKSDELVTFVVPLGSNVSETEYYYNNGYFVTADTTPNAEKTYYTRSFSSYHECAYMTKFETQKTYYEYDQSRIKFFVTSDTTVNHDKTYYTKATDEENKYYECYDLESFESGVTYYEYDDGFYLTSDTTVNHDKSYYTRNYNYSAVDDLTQFEKWITYYEYNEYTDESNLYLTIDGLADGSVKDNDGYAKLDDMIYDRAGVLKYGWIGMTYENHDLTLKENLLSKGIAALTEQISPKRTIEITAVDMHLINPKIKPIKIGEYVRVRSMPHKLDSYFVCSNIDLDLNNPENSAYTLGVTYDTLTGQQNKRNRELNSSINTVYEAAKKSSMKSENKEVSQLNAKYKVIKQTTDDLKTEVQEVKSALVSTMEMSVAPMMVSAMPVNDCPISLWYDEEGVLLGDDDSVQLNMYLSDQSNGLILCWHHAALSKWKYFTIPKDAVGDICILSDAYLGVMKEIVVNEDTLTGTAINKFSGKCNNIEYDNTEFVLRKVIGY